MVTGARVNSARKSGHFIYYSVRASVIWARISSTLETCFLCNHMYEFVVLLIKIVMLSNLMFSVLIVRVEGGFENISVKKKLKRNNESQNFLGPGLISLSRS